MSTSETTPNDAFGDEPVEEYIEMPGLSEQDLEDLAKLDSQPELEYHSVLQVWQTVLESADRPDNRHMTPKWAMAIISQYVGIGFADLPDYVETYFDLLSEMTVVVNDVILLDDDCFKVTNATEDVEANRSNFLAILRDWQLLLLTRELEWDPTDPFAAVQIAALSEIQKLFFGQTGLTGHLEAIKLEVTEEDQIELATVLEERRDLLMGVS